MGTVVLAGATSGSTTLTPTDAVTATITLPSATGTLVTVSGAIGTPTSGVLTNCTGLPATTGISGALATGRVLTTAGNATTSSTSLVDVTSATITFTTGARPVIYGFEASAYIDTINLNLVINVAVDGSLQMGAYGKCMTQLTVNTYQNFNFVGKTAALTAASHTVKTQWLVGGGTGTIAGGANVPYLFWAQEVL